MSPDATDGDPQEPYESDSDPTTPIPDGSTGDPMQNTMDEDSRRSIPTSESVPAGLGWPASPSESNPVPTSAVGPTNGSAVAALVCGILGVTACPLVLSIAALILGYNARSSIRQPGSREQGDGLASAGIVMGWIGVGIAVAVVLVWVAMLFVFGIASTAFGS